MDRGHYMLAAVAGAAIIVAGVVGFTAIMNWPQTSDTIAVTGSSSALVLPDRVVINLGVDSHATTASSALTANTQAMNQVVSALKGAGLTDNELATRYFNIQPVYNLTKGGQILVGYIASSTVSITTNKTNSAGQYIDASVSAGANRVDSVSFGVSTQSQSQLKESLTALAVNEARARAEVALTPLGLKIIGVQSISLGETGFPNLTALSAGGGGASILPGQQTVSVTVQVTFRIGR